MANYGLYNDHFQNYKSYQIPRAQLVIADIPYNVGANAYGSNPMWYVGSASSLIACEELGFDYVGFEIDKEYYQKARARIDEFNQQMRMF